MLKQVVVVRTDLDMSFGKASAQVAHASLNAADRAEEQLVSQWKDNGARKIVLEAESEEQLRDLAQDAERQGLPYSVVSDLGHTELEPDTTTTLGIGPAPSAELDEVTGELSLL